MDHAILTRFNLPSAGPESLIRTQAGWLVQRAELFERYCLPSVRAQTSTEFGWLVFFDPESPAWLRDRVDAWSADNCFVPIYRAEVSNAELLSDIEAYVGHRHEWLVTTNLDNDDALAVNFVERIQSAPRTDGRSAVYLGNGLIRCNKNVYARVDRANAFCSVREPWAGGRTCWSEWHNLLGATMPTQVLDGSPGWLQLVHGKNVTNRVHGRLIAPDTYRQLFPGALEDTTQPSRAALIRDALVDVPRRWCADKVRQAGKATVMRLAGKNGLERTKWVLATVRRRAKN